MVICCPPAPLGDTSVTIGGAEMLTASATGEVHGPYPLAVQTWTCHSAVPFSRATGGTTLHSVAASQPAAAARVPQIDRLAPVISNRQAIRDRTCDRGPPIRNVRADNRARGAQRQPAFLRLDPQSRPGSRACRSTDRTRPVPRQHLPTRRARLDQHAGRHGAEAGAEPDSPPRRDDTSARR